MSKIQNKIYGSLLFSLLLAIIAFFLFYKSGWVFQSEYLESPPIYNLFMYGYMGLSMLVFIVVFHFSIRRRVAYINILANEVMHHPMNIPIKGNDEITQLALHIQRMYNELRSLNEKERKEEQKRYELISNLSHDIRTPLTTIVGYLELLQSGNMDPEYINVALRKANHLRDLANNMFEYIKVANPELELHKTRINLILFLQQIISEHYLSLEEKHIELSFEPSAKEVWVDVDAYMLQRILDNLLSNVEKHGVDFIRITVADSEQQVNICIENGCKENNMDTERLFDRFYTGNEARSEQNNGLGLTIVREMVIRNGGKIALNYENGVFGVVLILQKSL